eukprot:Sspe_Gene.44037::Locus_21566_Transcript_1_1_Confidence_1.000_Length_3109::g.44037::m.44037
MQGACLALLLLAALPGRAVEYQPTNPVNIEAIISQAPPVEGVGENIIVPHAPIRWDHVTPGTVTAVTSHNGTVYGATSDNQAASQLYALKADDGTLLWNQGIGGAGISTPAVAQNRIYSTSGRNPCVLRCFSTETFMQGCPKKYWEWADRTALGSSLSRPVLAPDLDLVFVTTSAKMMYAINSTNGGGREDMAVWSTGGKGPDTEFCTPAYDPVTQYVVVGIDGGIAAFKGATGEKVWYVPDFIPVHDPPTVVGGAVLFASTTSVAMFNISTGKEIWTLPTAKPPTSPVVADGLILFATAKSNGGVADPSDIKGPSGVFALNMSATHFSGSVVDCSAINDGPTTPGTSTANIKYVGLFSNASECKEACNESYRDVVTAYSWYSSLYGKQEWQKGCYCRVDGKWDPVTAHGAVSGRWQPPGAVWFAPGSASITQYSQLTYAKGVAFVSARNISHEALIAVRGGKYRWSYTVPSWAASLPSMPHIEPTTESIIFAGQDMMIRSFAEMCHAPPCLTLTATLTNTLQTPSLTTSESTIVNPKKESWWSQPGYVIAMGMTGAVLLLLLCCLLRPCRWCEKSRSAALENASPGKRYQVVSKLGSGSYGVVFLVKRKRDGELFAMKYLSCDSDEAQERALLEFRTMRSVQGHPNMIRVQETFMSWMDSGRDPPLSSPSERGSSDGLLDDIKKFDNPRYVCIVMPFYKQGDLKSYVLQSEEAIPEEIILMYVGQLCSLLHYLHDRDPPLIHRDLKPENILIADDLQSIVVTDFGLAKFMHLEYCATRAGTLSYMAPECWSHHYGKEADMWAVGCILYAVATRRVEPHTMRVMFSDALKADGFQEEVAEELQDYGYSVVLAKLTAALLEPDYHRRPSAADLLAWLQVSPYKEPSSSARVRGTAPWVDGYADSPINDSSAITGESM